MGVYAQPWNSVGVARFDVQQLKLTTDDPAQRGQALLNLAADIGPLDFQFSAAGTDLSPPWVFGGNNNFAVLYLAGCNRLSQAAGYLLPAAFQTPFPFQGGNNYAWAAALAIAATCRMGAVPSAEIRCVGHSLGGVIGMGVNRWLAANNPLPGRRRIVTFGSPKPGNIGITRTMAPADIIRYFLPIDPVPLFPFDLETLLAAGVAVTGRVLSADSTSWQVRGGVQLNGDFSLSDPITPTLARATPFTSAASWLLNLDQGGAGLHSLQSYGIWFDGQFAATQGGGEWETPRAESPAPSETPAPAAQRNAYESRVQTALALASQQQHVNNVTVPKQKQLVAFRDGATWFVSFGDIIISVEQNKQHARAIARLGNIWLERMLTSAVVDPNAVVQSLQEFLLSAQDPNSGISPNLNTQLPL